MKKFFFLNASDRAVMATLVTILAIAAMAVFFTSCTRDDDPESTPMPRLSVHVDADTIQTHATVTFSCRGFELQPFTRSLEADGKQLTDLWVLDYIGTTLAQHLHQVNTDEDFGTPTLNLAVGSHHIYFVASRGQGATLDTEAHTLIFTKVLDTFYKDLSLDVTATSSGSRTVTLDRCVTKLKVIFEDEIPSDAATFYVTPAQWYYGINYLDGSPTAATSSQNIVVNIPSSSIGKTGESLNVYGFSSTTEWTTDVSLNCKKSDGTVLGSATLTDVPLKRNRVTSYSGPLFSANGQTTVGLSTDWEEQHTSTW